jgi:hypothetical protein
MTEAKLIRLALGFLCLGVVNGAVYEVGPGKKAESLAGVPWQQLQPGDTVAIYWRSAPYKEKLFLTRQGAAQAPITIRGVAGPGGELPVIDGNGATTTGDTSCTNGARSVVQIGCADYAPGTLPSWMVIENLDIRSGRPPYSFTDPAGTVRPYAKNAAAFYLQRGENIIVRNCIIHDGGNGFFVASSNNSVSRNILVEGNYIYDNGIEGSIYEHNNYTAALDIVFQYNHFGPLRTGCPGNNLKDRSVGQVVRYNWIEGGNRQLDLVDAEDSIILRQDPRYHQTYVYGNILIEPGDVGNSQIVHYGGDSGSIQDYRKGTLYFYNNTVISMRTNRTNLFRLSTNEETADARNNIVYVTAPGSGLSLLSGTGTARLSHNWTKPGWVPAFEEFTGKIEDDGTGLQGETPGFVAEVSQDYHLAAVSPAVRAGGSPNPAVLPAYKVDRQYVKHQMWAPRPTASDIGALGSSGARDKAIKRPGVKTRR